MFQREYKKKRSYAKRVAYKYRQTDTDIQENRPLRLESHLLFTIFTKFDADIAAVVVVVVLYLLSASIFFIYKML